MKALEDDGEELMSRGYVAIRPRLGAAQAIWEACRAFSGRAAECISGSPLRIPFVAALAVLAAFVITTTTATPLAYARTSHTYESVITEVPAEAPGGTPVPTPGLLNTVSSMTVFSGDLYVAEHLEGEGIAGSASRTDQWVPSVSKPGEYEFASQLPLQPEPGKHRNRGIAFGAVAGEREMYIGQEEGSPGVDVFAAGMCGNLECASSQGLWTGIGAPSPFKARIRSISVDHSASLGDWASEDVFVAEEYENPAIDIFEPEAGGKEKYVSQVTGPSPSEHFGELRGIAVSGFNGDLVVGASDAVYVFHPKEEGPKKGKYVFVKKLIPPSGRLSGVTAVAADDGNGEIYAATTTAVYEFDNNGMFLGEITGVPREGVPTGVKGQAEEVQFNERTADPVSLAVDPGLHKVFVGLFGSQVGPKEANLSVVDVFGPDVVVPDVSTGEPFNLELATNGLTGGHSWSILATGTVNPDSAGEVSCWFVWGLSRESLDRVASCGGMVPDGSEEVPVAASLSGLEPDTTYYYRLQASNAQGTNLGEESQDYSFTTPGPGLRSESVSKVTSSSASFEGTVAPHDAPVDGHDLQVLAKSPTSYYFQYSAGSTDRCVSEPSMCVSVPFSPVSIGSGMADVEVSQHVQGLTVGGTYHYRLVAVNEALPESAPGVLSAFYGQDRTFTMQGQGGPAVVLPDGREWELVSPVDKRGAKIEPSGQGAVGGDGFTFVADIPTEFAPAGNPSNSVQVLSSRVAPGEWASVNIPLSHDKPEGSLANGLHEYRFFSEDLGLAVAESEGPFSVPEGWHQNTHGEWEHIVEASPVPTEHTPYLRHNATCSSAPASCFEPLLDGEDVTSGQKYGTAIFVGATPDASHLFIRSSVQLTTAEAPEGGLYEWTAGAPPAQRLSLVGGASGIMALLPDGSRVFLGGCNAAGCSGFSVHDVASGEAASLAVTESGSPAIGLGGFWGASVDGTRAFFTYNTRLTSDAGLKGSDLYVCELGVVGAGALKCGLRDLTPVPAAGQPGANENAQVTQVLGVSRDGGYVYFLANGVLAAGATPGENLYVAHEHEGSWTTTFVASPQDVGTTHVVSPDGQLLAFSSKTSLTGYDNRDAKTGVPDNEVYLYNAVSGKLVCASCNPSGARPSGPSEVPSPLREFPRPRIEEFFLTPHEAFSRSLFDGGRLFFNSGDGLVSQDTNGNVDVYEYEPAGVGSCTSASVTFSAGTGACVGLISSGVASGASVFWDASGTGGDAFFTTKEQLVGRDVDTAVDLYDAHECTAGSPCAGRESSSGEECGSAASCRPAPLPQPSVFGAPSSALFSGAGNVVSGAPGKPKPTPAQVRAEKLRKALKMCRKQRARGRRVVCERKARRRYGSVKSSKASVKRRVSSRVMRGFSRGIPVWCRGGTDNCRLSGAGSSPATGVMGGRRWP